MLPSIDPVIKLVPTIKLIGKLTVSSIIRSTLLFSELFWIPIINNKNKDELNEIENNNFLNGKNMHLYFMRFSSNYILHFF